MCWWSQTYKRPLKDPVLLSYTFEELLFEYYDKIIREEEEKAQDILGDGDNQFGEEEIEKSIEWIKKQQALDDQDGEGRDNKNEEDISEIGEDLSIDEF